MKPSFADLWAALPSPALILDEGDIVRDVNGAAESFLNASRKSLIGAPVWERVMIAADLERAMARVRAAAGEIYVNAVDVSTGSTTPVSCNLQIGPIGEAGSILMVIAPRRLADRIGRADHAKSAAKSAIGMAEMLAHEIKNPLAGITGAAQLLAMNLEPPDREMTDLIVAETRRILKLLDQVEQFGNLSPPNRRAVNLHDLLDRARKSATVGFAANMKIVEDYDPSLPSTFADGDQLLQVFLNLIKNAAEAAGPKGGTITLHTYYEHSLMVRSRGGPARPLPLQVEIIDDGPGLPPDLGDEIFEPFISGKENGTGLGLALVSKIVADHEGWLTVESVPGHTAFRLSLPIAPEDKEVS